MNTLTALDFANETDVSVSKLQEKARQGDTVSNIDLGEHGVFEHHADTRVLTKVRVPSRLLANLGPGGVSETSDMATYEAGKEAERGRENSNSGSAETPESVQTLVETDPPAMTSEQTEVQSRRSGSSSGMGDFLFWAGAAALGAAVWGALSEDDSLTREQYEQIRLEGAKARLDGSTVNPYADNPEARDAFRNGWWVTDTKMREQIAMTNGVSVTRTS